MNIIPVINCPDRACVEKTIAIARNFLGSDDWVHIDVTDGVFSKHATFSDPAAWNDMEIPFNFEVHLMVSHPEDYIAPWLAAEVNRIIVHVESITPESSRDILKACSEKGVKVMLALNPNTPIRELEPYINSFSEFLVLSVSPGPGGQEFNSSVVDKIKILKHEGVIIEVDGGMNAETALLVKNAGADIIASGSYIFGNVDPKKAYEELKNI